MIELEKTYLAKYLPERLKDCKYKEIIDIYYPKDVQHPKLRLRKSGTKFELTKKEPVDGDVSKLKEQTIILTEEEFNTLKQLDGKKVHKLRYYYNHNNQIAEFDIFQGDLKGLVVIDFEFETEEAKNGFIMPEFCLVDITTEDFIAGGMICGKSYEDVKEDLERFNYKKLSI